MQCWFKTLNEALESETLIEYWDCTNPPISYGETRSWSNPYDHDSKHGKYISIYRSESGMYERPIQYEQYYG
jgi:hypothetical protein